MGIANQIREILKGDQDPVINLNYGMLVVPEKKKPGRKKIRIPEPTEVEKTAKPLLGDSTRPKCLNPHCRRRLKTRKIREYVCNDHCREEALMAYESVVDLLRRDELPAKDVPDVFNPQTIHRRVHLSETEARSLARGLGRK